MEKGVVRTIEFFGADGATRAGLLQMLSGITGLTCSIQLTRNNHGTLTLHAKTNDPIALAIRAINQNGWYAKRFPTAP